MSVRPNQSMALDKYQRVLSSLFLGAVGLVLVGLVGRVVYINTALHPALIRHADRQRRASSLLPARRGMILDSRGRVVAASRLVPEAYVDAARVENVDALADSLGVRLHLSAAALAERIRRLPTARFVRVGHQLEDAEADAIRALRNPAVGLTDRDVRTYPLGESMAHVIGFVGREGRGLEGLEKTLDGHLRGRDGRRSIWVDARRRALGMVDEPLRQPADGGHVVLTVDSEIQRIAERAVDATLHEFDAESGVAVVVDPATGDVLALACRPAFDANLAAAAPEERRRNRALTDPIEPGSTLKPFIMYGALEGGHVRLNDQFDCHRGEFFFGSRRIADTSPHGMLDPMGIMTVSSNIGMGMIGQRMGNTALYQTVRRFGFGAPFESELPGAGAGRVQSLRKWTSMSAVSVAMGYEVSLTPLQLVTGFCSLVNGGRLVRPRVVRRLLHADGSVALEVPVSERGPRLNSEVVRHIHEMLISVVENGTGKRARLERFRVMGKTGTPKLSYLGRKGYESGAYQPTFVGAAPASDPRIAVVVTIRRPDARRGYYGGVVAAPAAAKIIDETLQYLGVPNDRETLLTGL